MPYDYTQFARQLCLMGGIGVVYALVFVSVPHLIGTF